MATLQSGKSPHNHWATFPKGRARENTSGGWRLRFFLPLGAQEQAVEVVLGDALIGAAVLEEEIG